VAATEEGHDREHRAIARWERRWLSVSGLVSLVFVILVTVQLATEGTHIAQRTSRADPAQLTSLDLFATPGVTALGPGRYRVAVVAQTFSFTPAEIRLPVGAEVDFYLTSRDVLHGYQLQDTTINVEVIPGEISYFRYTFNRPGEYAVICNEYCGISHQNMLGRVHVVPASQVAQPAAPAGEDAGAALYAANCASCHQANGQGVAGVFPPMAGHAPDLLEADRGYLVDTLLYGLQGPIQVDGATYNGVMPAWGHLSDMELADILNHTLTAWGNAALLPEGAALYTPDDVAARRGLGLTPADVLEQRQALPLP
jgi:heme/copper-type cytochrome/quinol oxidase subunit 2